MRKADDGALSCGCRSDFKWVLELSLLSEW